MRIEIEAEYRNGVVDVSVGDRHIVTLQSGYNPYRANDEMIVTAAVADWLEDLDRARRWVESKVDAES